MTRIFAVVLVVAIGLVAGCSSDSTGTDPFVDGPVAFWHVVIDSALNAGADCCADVLAAGDIDGDNLPDLVLGAENAPGAGLVWYRNPDWKKFEIASGQFTTDGQVADMDGDGDHDVVTCNHGVGIFWYDNAGDTMSVWPVRTIGSGYAHDLEVGDVDADGDMDVVTCDKQGVTVWLRQTDGSYSSRRVLAATGEGLDLANIDNDSDLDICFGASWIATPEDPVADAWVRYPVTANWPEDTRARAFDVSGDGRLDLVLTASEGQGRISWFEAPVDPTSGNWTEHGIETNELTGAHSLRVGDIDLDGDADLLTAEMHTSTSKRILVYFNDNGRWEPTVLATTGSHNMRLADLDGDGDLDAVGKNYAGTGKRLEAWINQAAENKRAASLHAAPQGHWYYAPIDTARGDDQHRTFGLVIGDINGDRYPDVAAGSVLYFNPVESIHEPWEKLTLGKTIDLFAVLSIHLDGETALCGIAADTAFWITPAASGQWEFRTLGLLNKGRTQGYVTYDIDRDRLRELVFTRGSMLYCLDRDTIGELPRLVVLSRANAEEGVAVADIDRDGWPDIACVAADGHSASWLRNPGGIAGEWSAVRIGAVQYWMDRLALADLNGDLRFDLIATEELPDTRPKARVVWFEAPADPSNGIWIRHEIAALRSVNSLDIVDGDGDGDVDIIIAEHTDVKPAQAADDNLTLVLYNDSLGLSWRAEIVEQGPHSSHLGGQAADVDLDGYFDIVSIGWHQYQSIHLWTRTAPPGAAHTQHEEHP